jgi:hypothetical protein
MMMRISNGCVRCRGAGREGWYPKRGLRGPAEAGHYAIEVRLKADREACRRKLILL